MNKRFLQIALLGFLSIIIFNWSCTKIDTTTLGGDLLPEVDNINTFADTLEVTTTQGYFPSDSLKVARSDNHVLGKISNDPLFGGTTAEINLQFKPPFYPYYFGNGSDTIMPYNATTDSVILCLEYRGVWGDSTVPLQLQAFNINNTGIWDSVLQSKPVTFRPSVNVAVSDVKTIDIRKLDDKVLIAGGQDSITRQLRIKLNSAFAEELLSQDSAQNGFLNGFYSDAIFRTRFRGFSIRPTSGNALIYSNLVDGRTRLEFHYRKKRGAVIDTAFTFWNIRNSHSSIIFASSTSNYIKRDSAGFPVTTPDPLHNFIQTSPGTYVNVSIPELTNYANGNVIVHRAQLRIEQAPHMLPYDTIFPVPNFLYLDLKDTPVTNNYFKPVYFDLNPGIYYQPDYLTFKPTPFYPSQVDFGYFGGFVKKKFDPISGRNHSYYDFNLTRYVQQIITDHTPNYNIRVYAPFTFKYPQFSPLEIPYNNNVAFGRIRVGSGINTLYPMRMIIIYSKTP